MKAFDHEKLDVYGLSINFVAQANAIAQELPRGRKYLADQLHRASSSVPLNIAEGAGEFAPKEKARFYRMARRSATECAAILDVCQILQLIAEQRRLAAREILLRIVSILIQLTKSHGDSTGCE